MARQCDCALCQRHRAFEERLSRVPESDKEWWENLYDYLYNVEFDLEYAVEILEERLRKAKEKRKADEPT